MANKKITELAALTDPDANDLLAIVDDPSGSPVTKQITATKLVNSLTSQAATFVVAASNSLHKARADYVCDGVDDQVEIQAAIDALPTAGGKVMLLEGSFFISSPISTNTQLTIEGTNSYSTRLYLVDNADCNMFEYQGSVTKYFISFLHLYMNGNKANNAAGHCIYMNDKSWDGFIFDCFIEKFKEDNIRILHSWGWRILTCCIEHSDGYGVRGGDVIIGSKVLYNDKGIAQVRDCTNCVFHTNHKNSVEHSEKVIGCYFTGNGTEGPGYSDIVLGSASPYVIIANNYFNGGGTQSYGISESLETTAVIKNNIIRNYAWSPILYRGGASEIYTRHSDHLIDVLGASATHIHAAITGTGAEQEITTAISNPDVPRNTSITNSANSTGDVKIDGVDAKGNTVSDTITIVTGGIAYGVVAFATVSKITIPATVANPDTISVGISDKLGLSNVIYETGDVYKIKKNNADVTVATAQVNTTYNTYDMSVIGLAATDDFTIWYRCNSNIIV